jgi:chloramphenicol-sensitive protein RarD
MTTTGKGYTASVLAFAIWGVLPLYLHPLHEVPAIQVIANRVVWSCIFVLGFMALRGELQTLRAALANRGIVWRLAITAALISTNWFVYVWAVLNGHVLDSSLGYFINPLVNVVLGVALLSERLRPAQWTAVGLAAAGVLYLTVVSGKPPWIALTLALTFGFYGLIRKLVRIESLPSLGIETLLLLPFAAAYLLWCESIGMGAFWSDGAATTGLLIGSGPVTAIALFLFAYGARRLPYATVGILQYIAPTLQLACGVFAFHEPFGRTRAVGFAFIWAALIVYAGEGVWLSRKPQRAYA